MPIADSSGKPVTGGSGRWQGPPGPVRSPESGSRVGWRAVLVATLVPLGLAYAVSAWLGTEFQPLAMVVDVLLLGLLLSALRLSARGPIALWVAGALFATLLVVSHAFKVAQLQLPVLAADATALVALLQVLSGWRLWLAAAILAGLLVLAVFALWPRRRGWHGLLLAAVALLAMIFAGPSLSTLLQKVFPPESPDSLVERLERYGGPLFLVEDYAGFRRDQHSAPSSEELLAAVAGVEPPRLAAGPAFKPRNVHVVLLETAWDPLALAHYQFSRDPFDPRFRRAMELSEGSAALVPGFGGATANAEFEVLCGLPATRDQVAFEHTVKNPMPCLPRLLREAGYLSLAHHPYHADFWNRDEAYPHLGFERYYPINAFELDSMDGMFLADDSMYRQLLERLQGLEDGRPVFNYVVSLSAHYPYERDARLRPDLVAVSPEARLLEGYANAIAYATTAFMDYVDAVHLADPDALIVAFGDHAPALGHAPDPYKESGIDMSSRRGMRSAEALPDSPVLSMVPLLVFDGRQGVVPVGKVPLFALPDLVLTRLGDGAPESMVSAFRKAGTDPARMRQFLGHMMIREDAGWRMCQGDSAACRDARALRDRLVVLRQDLARGEQHALDWMQASALSREPSMAIEKPHADCSLEVLDWGPKHVSPGAGFNVQPDGKSTFWFKIGSGRGKPSLRVGDEVVGPMTIAGKAASGGITPDQLDAIDDGAEVAWVCPDGTEGRIGSLSVSHAPPPVVAGPAAVPGPGSGDGGDVAAANCRARIRDFGPRRVKVGEGFNVQPDGQSAFWMVVESGSEGFALWAAGEEVVTTRVGDTLSFGARGAVRDALSRPGELRLELRCGDRVEAEGEVQVEGDPQASRSVQARPDVARFIAHAGGLASGWDYTNSREALDENYRRGFRFFEVDMSWTADDHLVLVHDWKKTWRRYFGGEAVPTREQFLATPMRHGLSTLSMEDVIAWLGQHPDAFLVTDVKERNLDALQRVAAEAGPLVARIVPQAYGPDEIAAVRALGYEQVILTVYRSRLTPAELTDAAREGGAWALTIPEARARNGEFSQALAEEGLPVYVHTVNDAAGWSQLRELGVDGLYTDSLLLTRRDEG